MRNFLESLFRIITRAGFLAVALLLGLVFWYLPNFMNLDAFRPALVTLLESTFQCHVLIGDITAHIVPAPGLSIGHVVFLDTSEHPRILASVSSVHLSLSPKPLLHGHLVATSIRFIKPRLIVHRDLTKTGESRWALLKLPKAHATPEKTSINDWQIRNGTLEIWNHTKKPMSKWIIDRLNGSFQIASQAGVLAGKASPFGRAAMIDLHYDGNRPSPLQARVSDMELAVIQPLIPTRIIALDGLTDLDMKARFEPALKIQVHTNQPANAGDVTADIRPGLRGSWYWSAQGKNYHLKGTSFTISQWSAKGDAQGLAVFAHGNSNQGGEMDVSWTQLAGTPEPELDVDASSVTIRQILDIFHLPPKSFGYEPWIISTGSMRSIMHDKSSLEVIESDITVAGMHLDLTGTFGLRPPDFQAHIDGELQNIAVPFVLESFFSPPPHLTGTGRAHFSLSFPTKADWVKGLNGFVELEVDHGIVHALRMMYRIVSLLNLTNYLRLRLPQVAAKGIVFDSLTGHISFQNGILSSEDLFLKSPDMNVGVKGSLDIPGRRIKTTLRLEMLRFLEDILKVVPITHWIFKKPNKIFLPLLVTVEGPWENVDIH